MRRIRNVYRYIYHINEVINRISCSEKNYATEKFNDDKYKDLRKCRRCLYKMLNYQQRKSLIYYWCTLNNIKTLYIEDVHYMKIKMIMHDILMILNEKNVKKTPDYKLIMYCVCKKMNYDYILPYLFFKNNEKHVKMINDILNDLL